MQVHIGLEHERRRSRCMKRHSRIYFAGGQVRTKWIIRCHCIPRRAFQTSVRIYGQIRIQPGNNLNDKVSMLGKKALPFWRWKQSWRVFPCHPPVRMFGGIENRSCLEQRRYGQYVSVPKGSKTLPYAGLRDEELDRIIRWHCNDNSNTMTTAATEDNVGVATTATTTINE